VTAPGFRAKPLNLERWLTVLVICSFFGCDSPQDVDVAEKGHAADVQSPDVVESERHRGGEVDFQTAWRTDLKSALAEARQKGKPLLVVSILGDLKRRC
jgi:hypothetical protein